MTLGCCSESENKNFLKISWQRFVENNKTCSRCESTEIELLKAVSTLRKVLKTFGIQVVLEKKEIKFEEFEGDPLSSNKIVINGRSLEEWLKARAGKSQCCDLCAPNECRTVELNGRIYEVPSSELIVKAGIEAVKELLSKRC
ncbi:MAG: DUF2703 domain-containing protein [Archaeoglobaceae archaeon]|nr:DUF2703 domain-containing protein [Archaeoglobaceae archaeon]MDW8128243.1 DUF2703 domain-containing protein [Archaeoglobaceae archaeon]